MFHQKLRILSVGLLSLRLFTSELSVATQTEPQNESATSTSLRFAAIGDMPYSKAEEVWINTVINPALDKGEFPFIIHLGDYKTQGLDCIPENDVFFKEWMAERNIPIFYTPGDNEWADCDYQALKAPTSELQRLEMIRSEYFQSVVNAPWLSVKRQAQQVENQSWVVAQKGINTVFGSLHVIGSNNGRSGIHQDNPTSVIKRVNKRDNHNSQWLDHIFKRAEEENAFAVVIAQHGDPSQKTANNKSCTTDPEELDCDPHFDLNRQLAKKAEQFGGPVLLMHGDTQPICLESDFYNIPNLWRFNSTGDRILTDAAVVEISSSLSTPFKISTLIWGLIPGECKTEFL